MFLSAGPLPAQSVMTTTIAGKAGSTGFVNGPALDARFNSILGMAIDPAGNIFVADTTSPSIRKLSTTGIVTTIAGVPGQQGSTDGPGLAARFNSPEALALDAQGNLFVSDVGNSTIRKISSSGVVTTLAGGVGQLGSADGVGSAARFRHVKGLAVDAAGNLYAADTANSTIRKITPAGVVTTLAGSAAGSGSVILPVDGIGPAARFGSPHGIVVDAAGNLYVSDAGYRLIRKVTPQGVVTTIAGALFGGGIVDGIGAGAAFSSPGAMALHPSGELYVLEPDMQVIRRVTVSGVVTTVAGVAGLSGFADGSDRDVRFNWPGGIVIDRAGDIFIADTRNYTLRRRGPVYPPVVTSQPKNTVVPTGKSTFLSVEATGTPVVTYQWRKNGAVIPGATTATLAFTNAQADDNADYTVILTNVAGGATSQVVRLTVEPPPIITAPPANTTTTAGTTLVLSPSFRSGLPATFQWQKNGIDLAGATGATLTIANVNPVHAGIYTVSISSAAGTVTSASAVVTVLSSRFANLSVRTTAGREAETLIVGFVVTGTSKPVLIRGVGAALAQYGVTGALADPTLTLFQGATMLFANDNWNSGADTAQLVAVADRVGAFPLPNPSRDAALFRTLNGGAYTAHVASVDATTGISLAELYDASEPGEGRLVNLSARAQVGTGEGSLIAGFVIDGNTKKRVLVRGAGPALSAFGVSDVLVDPRITVYKNGLTIVAANDDWAGDSEVVLAAGRVNAFPFVANSKDAALLLLLDPGAYTAQINGVGVATGAALIEVYEVP